MGDIPDAQLIVADDQIAPIRAGGGGIARIDALRVIYVDVNALQRPKIILPQRSLSVDVEIATVSAAGERTTADATRRNNGVSTARTRS